MGKYLIHPEELPKNSRIYIYGAGKGGEIFLDCLRKFRKDIKIIGFLDTFKKGELLGIKIIKFSDFLKKQEPYDYIVVTSSFWREIVIELEDNGIDNYLIFDVKTPLYYKPFKFLKEEKVKIHQVADLIDKGKEEYLLCIECIQKGYWGEIVKHMKNSKHKKKYLDYTSLKEGDIIIEGGVYDGSFTKIFIDIVGDNGKIFGFDPLGIEYIYYFNPELISRKNIEILPFALWSSNTILGLNIGGSGTNVSLNPSNNPVMAIKLDDFVARRKIERVDFIKMDIEGAEEEAIKGAAWVIKTFKPQMAISIYHRFHHYYSIPLLVLEYNPDYKIYFGIYGLDRHEKIMYFV